MSFDSNSEPSGVQMKRDVGLIGGVAVIVGTMIGSGIFASPKYVLMFSGSVGMALIVWTLCGVLAMCGALSYAELGTMIQTSGGESTYLLEAFGGLPSFLYIWTACIVIKPSQIAIVCLVFGQYVVNPFFPHCEENPDVQVIVKLLAAFAIGKFVCCSKPTAYVYETLNIHSNLNFFTRSNISNSQFVAISSLLVPLEHLGSNERIFSYIVLSRNRVPVTREDLVYLPS